ncbi:hypothetical protein WOLCODRAFT_23380 [Wolfiporia cocos MD-104 SS10]|uniref:Protein kinase domain-containing protein n=1 Tax=Wolfiporia cocos (strain MD-104) TaxID=742152 RepID=A0A2H3J8A0_WOLCO|nr:hypothetical protein WOLCODRAFT_23380 [Wolfiporia cocos MD-104 SS10]
MDVSYMTLWKPNEPLERSCAASTLADRVADRNLSALARELKFDETIAEITVDRGDASHQIVHVIVQTDLHPRERHIEEQDSGSRQRQERSEEINAGIDTAVAALMETRNSTLFHAKNRLPPSESARPVNYRNYQGGEAPLLDGRVGEGQTFRDTLAAPVELYCPAFSEFLTGLTDEPSQDVVKRIREMTLSQMLTYSMDRSITLGESAEDLIAKKPPPNETVALVIVEEDPELGSGDFDPTTKVSYSYERFWASVEYQHIFNASCCPSFLIARSGSWLCVLGAVWTTHVVVQRLTDFVWLGTSPRIDDSCRLNVARVTSSLRKAIVTLRRFYASFDTSAPPRGVLPCFLCPWIKSYYVGRLESDIDHSALPAAGPVQLYPRGPSEDDEEVEEVLDQVERALTVLHGAGLVYGDLHRPNVMVTDEGKVQLVDFDSAGKEGAVRYHPFISTSQRWPSGVKPYAMIKAEQDREMLNFLRAP